MKKTLFILFLIPTILFAQEYKFEKTDTIDLSNDELYSRTKIFIADFWNNANFVTQNDSKENIQVVGKHSEIRKVGMGLSNIYEYKYTVRFRMKDNKYRIEIYDIICTGAYQEGLGSRHDIPLIQPYFGETNQKTSSMGKGLSKKKANEMMNDLTAFFEKIIVIHENALKEQDEW